MAYDVASYQHQLQAKLCKLRNVETYNSQASMQQKHHYDGHSLEFLLLMIMCGFLSLQQANWIQNGKGDGLYKQ